MKAVAHFSCGSTSAIATQMALEEFGSDNVEIVYADPGAEHPDNQRFLRDCEEKLFQKKVTILTSEKYRTIFDVFTERRFLASPAGAPCTVEMKKVPIRDYLGISFMGRGPGDGLRFVRAEESEAIPGQQSRADGLLPPD